MRNRYSILYRGVRTWHILRNFLLTVSIGIIALISEFIFKQPQIAYLIIAVTGGFLAFLCFLK